MNEASLRPRESVDGHRLSAAREGAGGAKFARTVKTARSAIARTGPMTNLNASSLRKTWERYASAWKAPSADEKRALLDGATLPNAVYTDPLHRTETRDALIEYMLEFHRQVPGGHFETTWFMSHHGCGAARWCMRGADGTALGEGVSYVVFDDSGRLRSMTGFFESA